MVLNAAKIKKEKDVAIYIIYMNVCIELGRYVAHSNLKDFVENTASTEVKVKNTVVGIEFDCWH